MCVECVCHLRVHDQSLMISRKWTLIEEFFYIIFNLQNELFAIVSFFIYIIYNTIQ